MEFDISGVHYKISEATREHLEKKLERFSRLDKLIDKIRVIVTQSTTGYTVEIVATLVGGGESIRISESDEHLWPLIDIVFDRADNKFSREKERHERKV
jgi:ribosomal subunit interface protein